MLTDLRRNLRLVCVCACLLFVSGVFVLRAGFGDREDAAIVPGAGYIVRLRDQDGVPFDVAAGKNSGHSFAPAMSYGTKRMPRSCCRGRTAAAAIMKRISGTWT